MEEELTRAVFYSDKTDNKEPQSTHFFSNYVNTLQGQGHTRNNLNFYALISIYIIDLSLKQTNVTSYRYPHMLRIVPSCSF